ncbi:methionyl-tRNA formyltransferase [Staphylospora marina]|uniref:methionyl-tRNA formyltransferase n=1 Tax=Staphylospora marina TaxID=2490858 RepID=UPI000F5BEBCB|nr:methionyl-tRNA formyltransferase [Staphylospora marina]
MGTPDFAVPCLDTLVNEGYRVVGVVTQPDRPRGRKMELTPPPVKRAALKWGLPVFQPEKLREPDALEQVLALEPDLVVTAAYGQILPERLLKAPRFGCINVHASLLPRYRGGAPIHRAIVNGEKETGVTLMYMEKRLDAGDMIAQKAVPITERDHAGSMHDKLSLLGAELLKETLPKLLAGEVQAVPQDESLATFAPNLTREDERMDWNRSARDLACQVRGLHPWPVAFTTWNQKPLKVWWAVAKDEPAGADPGTIVRVEEDGMAVATGQGILLLTEVQPAGKTRMSAAEFARGRRIKAGERLGEG